MEGLLKAVVISHATPLGGCSVVDNVVISAELLQEISDFKVEKLELYSDHCTLVFTLGSKTFNSGVLCVDKGDSTKSSLLHHSLSEPMIWDSQVESLFRSRVNDSSSMQNLMDLQECMEKEDVNVSARMLEECPKEYTNTIY